MQFSRNVISGIIVWALIFLSFTIMGIIPTIKDSVDTQNVIILLLLIPFVIIGLRYSYKTESKTNGLLVGLVIIVCSLALDAMITLPLVIIPKGGSYRSFYTDPGLVIMGAEILLIAYLYWKIKVNRVETES